MFRKAATSGCAALALMCALPAYAIGDLVDVQIVDRTTGETLTPILHKGEWWIAGRPGNRYAVVLANRYARRTLNVLTIDGVNAVSGETGAWNQRGYVLDPYGNIQVAGWRTSMEQVAAFEFTTLANSYATRTGRPANLGVIGVAIFNERSEPIAQGRIGREKRAESPLLHAPAESSRLDDETDAPASPRANDSMKSETARSSSRGGALASHQRERIGTGYGATESSPTINVRFDRMQGTPNEIVTIRYDRRENLIAMGIIAPDYLPPVAANPDAFPNSGGFVRPPPPRR